MSRNVTRWWGCCWPYFAWVGLVVLFLWDCIFAGKVPYMRDTFCDMLPWRQFAGQAFADGSIPLWNHYANGSAPYMAMPQTAVLYPLHAPFYFLPAAPALVVWLAIHLWITGACMFGLAKHWRLNTAPALLASITFTFSTYTIAQMEFQSLFAVLAWTPLTIWLSSRYVERQTLRAGLRDLVGLSIVMALQCLAGHPQTFVYNLVMALVYVAVKGRKRIVVSIGGFFAAGVLAMGLCMAQLLLTIQLIPLSMRGSHVNADMHMASLHPRMLLGLLLPFISGRPGYFGQWWGGAASLSFRLARSTSVLLRSSFSR